MLPSIRRISYPSPDQRPRNLLVNSQLIPGMEAGSHLEEGVHALNQVQLAVAASSAHRANEPGVLAIVKHVPVVRIHQKPAPLPPPTNTAPVHQACPLARGWGGSRMGGAYQDFKIDTLVCMEQCPSGQPSAAPQLSASSSSGQTLAHQHSLGSIVDLSGRTREWYYDHSITEIDPQASMVSDELCTEAGAFSSHPH